MSRLLVMFAATMMLSATAVADDAAPEVCENGEPPIEWFEDGDGDGYGNGGFSVIACEAPEGYVDNDGDLHDGNPDILDG